MEMFVGFRRGGESDPFNTGDKDPRFERLPETACETRGQIILYFTTQQTWQFHNWTFSIGIFGNIARLFRWDRAGAIVSDPIPYCKEGNRDSLDFLRRFDMMDRIQRGWDPMGFDATLEETTALEKAVKGIVEKGPEEATAFEKAIKDVAEEGQGVFLKSPFATVGNGVKYPRKRIKIPEPDGEGERVVSYIVGRSIERAKSPTGRATRGFVAMSMDTKRLVSLKDSWCPNLSGMKGEGQWFQKLKGERNVSAFLQGSDVVVRRRGNRDSGSDLIQHTLTNAHSKKPPGMQKLMGYIHYWTVQCEFYVPLDMFRDSKHLTEIIRNIANGASLFSFVRVHYSIALSHTGPV